jgi:hypothetical protein
MPGEGTLLFLKLWNFQQGFSPGLAVPGEERREGHRVLL